MGECSAASLQPPASYPAQAGLWLSDGMITSAKHSGMLWDEECYVSVR